MLHVHQTRLGRSGKRLLARRLVQKADHGPGRRVEARRDLLVFHGVFRNFQPAALGLRLPFSPYPIQPPTQRGHLGGENPVPLVLAVGAGGAHPLAGHLMAAFVGHPADGSAQLDLAPGLKAVGIEDHHRNTQVRNAPLGEVAPMPGRGMLFHGVNAPGNPLNGRVFLPCGDGNALAQGRAGVLQRFGQRASAHDVVKFVEHQVVPCLAHKVPPGLMAGAKPRQHPQRLHAQEPVFGLPVQRLGGRMRRVASAGVVLQLALPYRKPAFFTLQRPEIEIRRRIAHLVSPGVLLFERVDLGQVLNGGPAAVVAHPVEAHHALAQFIAQSHFLLNLAAHLLKTGVLPVNSKGHDALPVRPLPDHGPLGNIRVFMQAGPHPDIAVHAGL